MPTRISGPARAWAGLGAAGVRLGTSGAGRGEGGTDPDTQPRQRTSPRGRAKRHQGSGSVAIVAKLELDPEVLSPEKRDHRLKLIARGCRHSDLITLDGRLNFLEALILDGLHHAFGDFLWNRLSQADSLPHTLAGGRLELS